MPLSFESASHGTVAFGFFNIDSDMLLLEHYFFFATDFCRGVCDLAEGKDRVEMEVYAIPDAWSIGDLQTAIHGVRYTGFIGDVYREFPFPKEPEGFKQKPEGVKNRDLMKMLIAKYAQPDMKLFSADRETGKVKIGEFEFSSEGFQELVLYVWRGGFPRWRDEQRPDYVVSMKKKAEGSGQWVYEGLDFTSA